MATKPSVSLVTLTTTAMIATMLLGAAWAFPVPANGERWVGPQPNDCDVSQDSGFDGNADGSDSGTGGKGYHTYANDGLGILLDACRSVGVATFPGCASSHAQSDVAAGLAQIAAGVSALNADLIQEGINTITIDLLNFYQDECRGFAGTGTDGELEYGTLAAALNVRDVAGVSPADGEANYGDGTDSCIGRSSTPHHGDDTTIFVSDLVLGAPEFHVSGDWARAEGQSSDNTDLNSQTDRPEISHCGDGAIEPCHADADPGYVNQLLTYGSTLGFVADVVETAGESTTLVHALDTVFGCNPLDCNTDVPASGIDGPNVWDWGAPLSTYCNGGAAGWLLVTVGSEVVPETLTLPTGTVGWIWTG